MKNILQDVILPKRGSIRDIPIAQRKNNIKLNKTQKDNSFKSNNSLNSKKNWWIFIVILIILAFFSVAYFFSGAEVNLVPKQEKLELDTDLSAVKGGIKTNNEGVPFKVITVSDKSSKSTTNVREKEVDKKASGKITIFNNYNSSPQKLIINTRFETSDGLIFRIPKYVVVPGKTVSGPGSVTVIVYADAPGEKYNIGLTDFTIPGFSGTSRFSKFYARSKTAMTGGFSGLMKTISGPEEESIRTSLDRSLTNSLESKIYSQLPTDYVLYKDGIFLSFEPQDNVDLDNSVQVVEKGTLKAIIFNKKILSDYIIKNVISGLGKGDVRISNLEDLNFKIKDKKIVDLDNDLGFNFNLKGDASFIWFFDINKMKSDFAGHSINDFNSILASYYGVKDADVTVSPFWKTSFPNNVNRIKIHYLSN